LHAAELDSVQLQVAETSEKRQVISAPAAHIEDTGASAYIGPERVADAFKTEPSCGDPRHH
jgi:hypothetical protein